MSDDSFDPTGGGDPVWFQDILWYFGHPSVWLALPLWGVLLIAIFKLATRLWRTRQTLWLALFIVTVVSALSYYLWLSLNAYSSFVEGLDQALVHLRYAKLVVVVLSILSAIWLVLDWLDNRRIK